MVVCGEDQPAIPVGRVVQSDLLGDEGPLAEADEDVVSLAAPALVLFAKGNE